MEVKKHVECVPKEMRGIQDFYLKRTILSLCIIYTSVLFSMFLMFAGPYRDIVGTMLHQVSLTLFFWVIGIGGIVLVSLIKLYSTKTMSLKNLRWFMKKNRGMFRKLCEIFNRHKNKAVVTSILIWILAVFVDALNLILIREWLRSYRLPVGIILIGVLFTVWAIWRGYEAVRFWVLMISCFLVYLGLGIFYHLVISPFSAWLFVGVAGGLSFWYWVLKTLLFRRSKVKFEHSSNWHWFVKSFGMIVGGSIIAVVTGFLAHIYVPDSVFNHSIKQVYHALRKIPFMQSTDLVAALTLLVAEPPRWLVMMAQGVVIGGGVLFLFVVSMLLIGQQKKREQQALQATTELQQELDETRRKKEALETKREKVKARLHKVENQKKAVFASESVRGWPEDLVLFQARLEEFQAQIEDLERDPIVEKYLHAKQDVKERQYPIHRCLSMLGEHVGKLLSYLDMDAIKPQDGIGATELDAFAEDPVGFFENRSFGIIEPLARRVRTLFREAQLSWEELKLSPRPFTNEKIGALLKQTQALLKAQTDLIEQKKESQIVAYLQRRKMLQQQKSALQQLREIEQKTTRYNTLLTKLNTRLKILEKYLE